MKKSGFLLLLLTLSASAPSYALKEFYSINRNVRALGMGGAIYAGSDDEAALFYNPAGLSLYDRENEMMMSARGTASLSTISNWGRIMGLQGANVSTVVSSLQTMKGQPIYADFNLFPYYVRKNFAVGFLVADTKAQVGVLGSDVDTTVEVTAISDSGLFIGYGRPLFDENFHVGATIKGIARAGGKKTYTALEIAQNSSFDTNLTSLGGIGTGIDMDVGMTYVIPYFYFGLQSNVSLVFNNLFASDLRLLGRTGNPPTLQRLVSLGWKTTFAPIGVFENVALAVDLAEFQIGGEPDVDYGARQGNLFKHLNVGIEAPIRGKFVLRAGLHQGYLTAGFGFRSGFTDIDLATYEEELSLGVGRLSSRRFAIKVAIGAGSPPTPPKSPATLFLPPRPPGPPPEEKLGPNGKPLPKPQRESTDVDLSEEAP